MIFFMKEIWKDIKGYEGHYRVSTEGRVRSLKRKDNTGRNFKGRVLKLIFRCGYFGVGLCKNGKVKTFYVHRLVAISFISNSDNKSCINHKNGIKTDNRIENLEWCSQKENVKHAEY